VGYLPARVFGYAFALFCLARDEDDPGWASHLRLDAAAALKQGLRYLRKTGDSLFLPHAVPSPPGTAPVEELVERLQTGSASARLAALWQIQADPVPTEDVVAAVLRCLRDRDPCIPATAARVLGALGPATAAAVPRLFEVLHGPDVALKAGAAFALG